MKNFFSGLLVSLLFLATLAPAATLSSLASVVGLREDGTSAKTSQSNNNELKVVNSGRASEVRTRTFIQRNKFDDSGGLTNTTLYTVTGGKTFYLTGFTIGVVAAGLQRASVKIQDGTGTPAATAAVISVMTGANTLSPGALSGSFPDNPMVFTTSVNLVQSNNPFGGVSIVGYEE